MGSDPETGGPSMFPTFELDVCVQGRRTVVALAGELDMGTAPCLAGFNHESCPSFDVTGVLARPASGVLLAKGPGHAAGVEGRAVRRDPARPPRRHDDAGDLAQVQRVVADDQEGRGLGLATGTDSYRLASTRARTEAPAKAG
ncbi:hypothetical protein WDV06_23495 [Streptomyces racemochromogenes]|uniref:Uncharacterized protein n=1 Tax=Streptomyces racemochromogenes TaxID=67353 RepID=A0ABW7PI12_9ACTN